MSVDLKCTTGTINYTDWLHVTAAKVASPNAVVWETWINVPVSNYNFIIPGLDPENYVVSFYDAPTNTALGTLRLQLIANALTNEFIYEKRYYKCGRGFAGDPAPGDDSIIDPYFTNKTVTAGFQEAFRFLIPSAEWEMQTTSTADDTFKILTGHTFSADEVFCIDIKLSAGTTASTNGSFYRGRVDVSEADYSVLLADKGKRHRLVGTVSTQVLNLPSLASLNEDDFYLFDNSCGGTAVQPKFLCDGTDTIKYNGFSFRDVAITSFEEFWVDRGDILCLTKVDDNWEVSLPWKGNAVGEHFMGTFKDHPNTIIEDGQIGFEALDGDVYPKLYWWVRNVLPSTHKIADANVNSSAYVHPDGKQGFFVVHTDSSNKKFRTGNWQNMSERALKDLDGYGVDPERGTAPDGKNDYPGGYQPGKLKNHRHFMVKGASINANGTLFQNTTLASQKENNGDFKYTLEGTNQEPDAAKSGLPIDKTSFVAIGSDYNIADNIGVVALRRI